MTEAEIPPAPAPPSPVRFSERELSLAHHMAALGIEWEPAPGMIVYDNHELLHEASPIQPHVYMIINYAQFLATSGYNILQFRSDWTWLPTWSEGREWLRREGKSDTEVFDRIRERILDTGITDLEALYELMIVTLRAKQRPEVG